MRQGKWIHLVLATCAASMIIYQTFRQPDNQNAAPVVAMVPIAQIGAWPEPSFSIPEPAAIPSPRLLSRLLKVSAKQATTFIPENDSTMKIETALPARAVIAPAPVDTAVADEAGRRVEGPKILAVAAPSAFHADNSKASEDRVHREVVTLIKNYIETHRSLAALDSKPVNVAIGGKYARVEMAKPALTPERSARWVAGVAIGPRWQAGAQPALPHSGLGADLYVGYELSRWLQLGVNVGYAAVQRGQQTADLPSALLEADLQMRLFLMPRAKVTPFLIIGAGTSQSYSIVDGLNGESGTVKKMTTPVAVAGAGAEWRIFPRIGAQVQLACRYADELQAKSTGKSAGQSVWELKAGLTLDLSGARRGPAGASSGLAAMNY